MEVFQELIDFVSNRDIQAVKYLIDMIWWAGASRDSNNFLKFSHLYGESLTAP